MFSEDVDLGEKRPGLLAGIVITVEPPGLHSRGMVTVESPELPVMDVVIAESLRLTAAWAIFVVFVGACSFRV